MKLTPLKAAGRLGLSAVGALLLPFPAPHVDSWVPMGAVLLNEDARSAPPLFFVVAGAILVVYIGLVFTVISLLRYGIQSWRRRREMEGQRS